MTSVEDATLIKEGGEGQYGNCLVLAPQKGDYFLFVFSFLFLLLSGTGGRDASPLDPPLDRECNKTLY